MKRQTVKEILTKIRAAIDAEHVSTGEIAYLQDHHREIYKSGDIILAEWSGITEENWRRFGC